MKKLIAIILSTIVIMPLNANAYVDSNIPANADTTETTPYSWYCKHTSDHSQPALDAPMKFIEECGGYYADKSHSDWTESEKVIYLTFDAGYENGNIEKILDTMKEKNVTGAFFVLENLTKQNANLVKRMSDEGHLVCNHTAKHHDMSGFSDVQFGDELKVLEKDCEAIGVKCSKYYRPPEGRFSMANLKAAEEMGYKTVFWSFAYVDWENNSQPDCDAAMKKILDSLHNGEVILLHPTSATNAAILGNLIDEMKNMGFRFGTLDELTAKK